MREGGGVKIPMPFRVEGLRELCLGLADFLGVLVNRACNRVWGSGSWLRGSEFSGVRRVVCREQ